MMALGASGCGGDDETVAVPGVRSANPFFAYERLRAAGLRVSIPAGLDVHSLRGANVQSQSPPPGARVRRGSTVVLTLRPGLIGSPTGQTPMPRAVAPDFTGQSAAEAVRWATAEQLYWHVRLAPLADGNADTLLDNYTVIQQQPRAGVRLELGKRVGRGFRPTPITVTAEQR